MAQPSGTVTLVFTDIEGSTRLLEELGTDRYREALAEHRRIVRWACARHAGYEVDTEGDAFFYAFASAQAAVAAVAEAMQGLDGGPIRIRVGIHTGEPALDPPNYVGLDVHRAARIMAAGHGGQVVLSPTTVALLEPDSFQLKELGQHRLKDLSAPIPLHQLQLDGLPTDFPPLKTLYRTNLPVPATPFLGRETEVAEVVARLTHPDTRLLTLTGPGGTGKTRLALQAAARTADHYPDGITWIPLAPLRDAALVIPSIARELSLTEQPDEQLVDTVATSLLGRRALLVLDNAEHLLPGVARELAALAAACPTLHLLVTSRERLQLTGETTWLVPTLSDTDSTDLFTQRARAVRHDFEPGADVAAICARLDHLPLAIELAAARARSLSPAAILERLGERLPVLTSRAHDVDDRQRTLEATIAWSYDLLDVEEQRALRALSIFAGGCTLDAAARVAEADLDLLEALLDKSLLRHRLDEGGHDRYWMLETIRDYAQARLDEAGETEIVFDASYAWLCEVVGEIDEYWIDRDQLEWFDTLERERPNLMQTIEGCRARERGDDALRLVAAAEDFIDSRGPYTTFLALLESLAPQDPRLVARATYLSLRLRLIRLGQSFKGAMEGSASEAAEGDPSCGSLVLALAAYAAIYQGRLDDARSTAKRALDLARDCGSERALGEALNALALIALTEGDLDAGFARLHESRRVWEAIGDQRNASIVRGNEAIGLLAAKRPEEARLVWEELVALGRTHDDPYVLATAMCNLAIAWAALGDVVHARAAVRDALERYSEQWDEVIGVEAPLVLALVALEEDAAPRAVELWAASEKRREEIGYAIGPELTVYIEDRLEPLRARPDFEAHWERGRALTTDQAIDLGMRPG